MKAVIFDAFGTLLHHAGPRINAYTKVLRHARSDAGRLPLLTRNISIAEWTEELGLDHLSPMLVAEAAAECEQIRPYDDVLPTLARLRGQGCKIALCSNLAAEFGPTVRALVSGLDAYLFSYELGYKKPEPEMYHAVLNAVGTHPRQCLFIGDSERNDVEGPRQAGMQARRIDRAIGQCLADVLRGAFLDARTLSITGPT